MYLESSIVVKLFRFVWTVAGLQKSLSYVIIILLILCPHDFLLTRRCGFDIPQWLFTANRELLWTSVVLSESWRWSCPLALPAFLSVFPGLLNTAATVWGVLCPDTQRVHCDFFFYLIVKAPEYADDQVDDQVVQKLQKLNFLKCLRQKIMGL